MTTKSKIISVLVVGALVAGGVMVIKNKKLALSKTPQMKTYALQVSAIKTSVEEHRLTLPYLALVQSDKNVALSSRISARIEKIFTCGQAVKKGEILVKLDTTDLRSKKRALELQVNSLNSQLLAKRSLLNTTTLSHERTEALLEVKGASQESYDKEKSAIDGLDSAILSLQNQIKITKENIKQINNSLTYAVLYSPIDGVASQCFANVGDISMPGKPLLNIESKNGKYLLIRSSENVKPKSIVYNSAEYPTLAMQNTFNGLDEYRAYLQTPLSSGQRVDVSLVTYKDRGLYLPLGALLQKDGKTYTFEVKGHKAEAHEVNIIAQGEEGVIVKGIDEGKELVVAKPDILLKLLSGVSLSVSK